MASACIEWHMAIHKRSGYGVANHYQGTRYAHRIAYCKHHGISVASIKGLQVRHTCDNRPCVNPEHLVLGTHMDNMKDRRERNRTARGERIHCAKLTWHQAREIRQQYVKGSKHFGIVALGKKFGVSDVVVSLVVRNKAWRDHVPSHV